MPTLSFEGSTHEEIVDQVRHWLAPLEGRDGHLTTVEAIEASAELTKDALDIIARAAPRPVGQTDLVRDLVNRGHVLTDASAGALVQVVEAVLALADENVESARGAARSALLSMSQGAARRVLHALTPNTTSQR